MVMYNISTMILTTSALAFGDNKHLENQRKIDDNNDSDDNDDNRAQIQSTEGLHLNFSALCYSGQYAG